jgi:ribosome-binding factor A
MGLISNRGPNRRAIRVGEELLKEISILLLERVKDPRVEGVTLTGISMTNDLREARVFFSVMPGVESSRARDGLESASGFIRRNIGAAMDLKYVPLLTFHHDPSLETAARMERLFEKIHEDR